MAGDGHIRKAQQRRCVMKTVQPYNILPLSRSPISLPSSLVFSCLTKLHTAFVFYSVFQVEMRPRDRVWCEVWFPRQNLRSSQCGSGKKQKWGHTAPGTSYRNYRNNESSICCDNFNELGGEWFYCSTETVNTNPRVMVMPAISPLPISQCCSTNVKLILIKPLEIEGLLILFPSFWHGYFSENKSSIYICLLCSLLVYEDAYIRICAKPTN